MKLIEVIADSGSITTVSMIAEKEKAKRAMSIYILVWILTLTLIVAAIAAKPIVVP
jgi:hypothetical protein